MINEMIITTDLVNRSFDLFKECRLTQSIGVIYGINGTGKTQALHAIKNRYVKAGYPGKCYYYRCCPVSGATRAVKDILADLGNKQTVFQTGTTIQYISKLTLNEFRKKNIQAVLLDEADLWHVDSMMGFLSLYDLCHLENRPLTLMMAGARPPHEWIGRIAASLSRTLRFEPFENLSPEYMMSILKKWCVSCEMLVKEANAGSKEAKQLISLIRQITQGNMRRMKYFATMLTLNYGDSPITFEVLEALSLKLKNFVTV